MKRAAIDLMLCCATFGAACGSPGSVPTGVQTGPKVAGTSAQVNGEEVSPLHEGQYIGQLEPVGGACRGTSGSSSEGDTEVTLYIDGDCRVYVDRIVP